MPEADTYGSWPASGEIDIMESRGNGVLYPKGGKDVYSSTLHWGKQKPRIETTSELMGLTSKSGPSAQTDAYWRTNAGRALRRTDYTKAFHTFGLEWSEKYLFTYIDSRLQQVLYVDFHKEDMWTKGEFTQKTENQTLLENPWVNAKRGGKDKGNGNGNNAPFDQKFFLILNVAVGSRNGWFLDGVGDKPWVDAGNSAGDFYRGMSLLHDHFYLRD